MGRFQGVVDHGAVLHRPDADPRTTDRCARTDPLSGGLGEAKGTYDLGRSRLKQWLERPGERRASSDYWLLRLPDRRHYVQPRRRHRHCARVITLALSPPWCASDRDERAHVTER